MSHGDRSEDKTALTLVCIGGFRGGAEGAAPPLFFLYFQNVLRFYFENRFMKSSLVPSPETFTLLNFASRIRSQCCMLHVLKSEVFIRGGWGTRPPLFEFSGSAPGLNSETELPFLTDIVYLFHERTTLGKKKELLNVSVLA